MWCCWFVFLHWSSCSIVFITLNRKINYGWHGAATKVENVENCNRLFKYWFLWGEKLSTCSSATQKTFDLKEVLLTCVYRFLFIYFSHPYVIFVFHLQVGGREQLLSSNSLPSTLWVWLAPNQFKTLSQSFGFQVFNSRCLALLVAWEGGRSERKAFLSPWLLHPAPEYICRWSWPHLLISPCVC